MIMEEFIKFCCVYFSYEKNFNNFILNDISFDVKQGEKIAIVGANGSGKTTLSKLLNAIYLPTKGIVLIDGINSLNKKNRHSIRELVGLVFQDPDNQIVATIVEEDVAFALENLCVEQKSIEKIVDISLDMVDMLKFKRYLVENLSGGQKSKVAIAGVLAMKPKCIVFDESTAMLNPKSRKEIINIMTNLNKNNNTTIINITHDMNEVVFFDRVIVLKSGKILRQGSPAEIFEDEELLKEAGLCLPQVSEFVMLLNKEGLVKEKIALSVDECVGIVTNLLKGEQIFEHN